MADRQPFSNGGVDGWRGVEASEGGIESLEEGDEVVSWVSGELVQSIGSSSPSLSWPSDRGSRERGRPESLPSSSSLSFSNNPFESPLRESTSYEGSAPVTSELGVDVI